MNDPTPELNPPEEPPTEFELHGHSLWDAWMDAVEDGRYEEADRIFEDIREYNRKRKELSDAIDWDERTNSGSR